jgi:FkbM family methyltransferase
MDSRFFLPGANRLARLIPDSLPGKTRVARILLRPFIDDTRPAVLPDRFGNTLSLPSLREPMALGLFAFGIYEPDTLQAILGALSPAGVYLDVGANIGVLALAVAARRPQARIVCVEADPAVAALLGRHVADNERTNVTVVEGLVGAAANVDTSFFRAPMHKFGMGSIGPQFDAEPMILKQRTLDDVLDEVGVDDIDVANLDIEGAEFGALQGLKRRLTGAKPPAIVFEFNDWAESRIAGQSAGDAQAFLLSIGYRLFRLARGGAAGAAVKCPLTAGSAMILALPLAS